MLTTILIIIGALAGVCLLASLIWFVIVARFVCGVHKSIKADFERFEQSDPWRG